MSKAVPPDFRLWKKIENIGKRKIFKAVLQSNGNLNAGCIFLEIGQVIAKGFVFFHLSSFFKIPTILYISGHQELWLLNFPRQIKQKGFSNFVSMVFP